ncbi:unnamed protein product [Coffea canephora]|uniref:Uncharacterized protein n=1 Tax=Coffea canephora TaxID=49390 RepID=A0A068VBM2_COFCA|nr:unnamed protein product [Coffea canephora]
MPKLSRVDSSSAQHLLIYQRVKKSSNDVIGRKTTEGILSHTIWLISSLDLERIQFLQSRNSFGVCCSSVTDFTSKSTFLKFLNFLGSPGLCTKFDCRSRGTTTVLSMSSSSRDEIAKDNTDGLTYKDAGVHIDAGSELVRRMAKMTPGIGGFRE